MDEERYYILQPDDVQAAHPEGPLSQSAARLRQLERPGVKIITAQQLKALRERPR